MIRGRHGPQQGKLPTLGVEGCEHCLGSLGRTRRGALPGKVTSEVTGEVTGRSRQSTEYVPEDQPSNAPRLSVIIIGLVSWMPYYRVDHDHMSSPLGVTWSSLGLSTSVTPQRHCHCHQSLSPRDTRVRECCTRLAPMAIRVAAKVVCIVLSVSTYLMCERYPGGSLVRRLAAAAR